ncbi:glycoside hydrolase [Fistulina hepatica ATCC 64428]|uniref:Alpha-galactosidase n=1 Tax=Fistulina hepatica ATCC 64428 TaxID=1128425 RepID=A0A0D7ACS9_9AGAR|nr:glycoside hydrolase [Fistulina hepatica ATCC 64428]
MMQTAFVLLCSAFFATVVQALDNGVARVPVLGYNTNGVQCDVDEDEVLTTAQLMVDLGLQAVGYDYVNIDDCYANKNRSADGRIVANTTRFANGMRTLTDKIHALGFKTGIYSDSGWYTCGGFPGSYSNEDIDAETFFIDWGFDYLKYDNCAIPFDSITRQGIIGRYERMASAIAYLSRAEPIVFSLCEWGWYLGHSWRTTGDIAADWDSLASIINLYHLTSGNGNLTIDEQKSHFTAWALMKSPLLIGTNLSAITEETLSVLANTEILAINQDNKVGAGISPFRWGLNDDWTSNSSFPAQYWSGPTSNGTVFMLLNTLNEPANLTFNLTESPWIRAGRQYSVRDLWSHTDNGTAVRNFTAHDVPAHGVSALLLKDAGNEPAGLYPLCSVWYECTAENGTAVDG